MYAVLNIENIGLLNFNIENVSVWRIIALLDKINHEYSQIMLALYSVCHVSCQIGTSVGH